MLTQYRRVLGAPHAAALIAASVLARLPFGIVSLALILFVEDVEGSFAAAGAVTALFALTAAVTGPLMGRLIDREGQTRVLLAAVSVHAAGLVALVALGLSGAPLGALLACAVAAGVAPPVSACLRPLLGELAGRDDALRAAAYAVDSILLELVFIAGPLLTGIIVALWSPQAALVTAAGVGTAGVALFTAQPPSRHWRGRVVASRRRAGPLVAPGMRTLAIAALGIGVALGGLEVAFAAYGTHRGEEGLGGVLIALQATGSAVGGLAYGVYGSRLGPLHRGYLLLACAIVPLVALIAAAPGLVAVAVLAVLSGSVLAPITAAENLLVDRLAPEGTLTEAFTWIVTALVSGVAAGNALAGAVVDAASWRTAIVATAAVAAAGAVVALTRRRTLVAPA